MRNVGPVIFFFVNKLLKLDEKIKIIKLRCQIFSLCIFLVIFTIPLLKFKLRIAFDALN
jgi:hypothetical protein